MNMRARYFEIRPAAFTDDRLLARLMTLEKAQRRAKVLARTHGPVRIIQCGDGWSEAVATVRGDE